MISLPKRTKTKIKPVSEIFFQPVFHSLLSLFFFILFFSLLSGCNKVVKGSERPDLICEEDGHVVFYHNGEQSDFSQGLPEKVDVLRFVSAGDAFYCITEKSGLFKRTLESEWTQLLGSAEKRRTLLAGVDEYRKITAFAVSTDGAKLVLAQKHVILESKDQGASWQTIQGDLDPQLYVTALAYNENGKLYVGTSYRGVFEKEGPHYEQIAKGLFVEPYAGEYIFYETIGSLTYTGGTLYASHLFNKGLYQLDPQKKVWQKVEAVKGTQEGNPLYFIQDIAVGEGGVVYTTGSGVFTSQQNGGARAVTGDTDYSAQLSRKASAMLIKNGPSYLGMATPADTTLQSSLKMKKAADIKAVYTNIYYLKAASDTLIRTVKSTGMNAVVIDVKDDMGDIYLPVDFSEAKEVGSLKPDKIDLKLYLDKLHKENIYVIARMVVFKDKRLFDAFDHKYAIWDNKYDRPWRAQNKEYWVDAHADFVRNYNIKAAQKAAEFGFDEIQFDYIRFPADGPLERCDYRYQTDKDMFKSEVLDDYLQAAKEKISVPVSVDIYGFTAFYNFGNRIGQDIEVFAKHVDAISAMIYPSHYGFSFYMKGPRAERPYRIVYATGIRSAYLSDYRAYVRPYLQAFDLKSPTYGPGYINYEVDAVRDSHGHGYIFWHSGGKYPAVRAALKK